MLLIKLIATISLASLAFLAALGNYWYTFGLWPRSWTAFFAFFVVQNLIWAALTAVTKDKS